MVFTVSKLPPAGLFVDWSLILGVLWLQPELSFGQPPPLVGRIDSGSHKRRPEDACDHLRMTPTIKINLDEMWEKLNSSKYIRFEIIF